MQKRSMFDELESLIISKDKDQIVCSRASHIIESAINLINFINDHYSEEDADELQRNFINSIKSKNFSKFNRTINKISKKKV